MDASDWPPAYGWGDYGPFSVRSGSTVRFGLTWRGDPGPVYLTLNCGTVPSSLVREHPTREVAPISEYYETTEWITVTATGAYGWADEITLSYLGTRPAADFDAIHEVDPPSTRFHIIAEAGRVLATVPAGGIRPGHPRPVVAPVTGGHVLHENVEISEDVTDPEFRAELLAAAVAGLAP